MIVLGIDPGVTTGWGLIQLDEARSMKVLEFGSTKDLDLLEIEEHFRSADVLIIEHWRTRPKHLQKRAFDWDPMITPQVIGAAKLLGRQKGCRIQEQSPADKPMGYGFLNQKYVKGKKNMHSWDALAHAAFYLVKHHRAKPLGR